MLDLSLGLVGLGCVLLAWAWVGMFFLNLPLLLLRGSLGGVSKRSSCFSVCGLMVQVCLMLAPDVSLYLNSCK